MAADGVVIPNRFESLREAFGGEVRPLIVPIDEDLKWFTRMREKARVQKGGLLCFLRGQSGIGKTTAVHSATVHMPASFAPVVVVPPELRMRDVLQFLTEQLPAADPSRSILVLFDGREISDDTVGVKQLLAGLNQLLRKRSDIVFCWPTTDDDWHTRVRALAHTIGASNFVPVESDHEVGGPPPGEWPKVLERLLLQFGKTYDDIGVASDLVGTLCAESDTVGTFLGKIGEVIAERVAKVQTTKRLPRLLFIVTSSGDVSGEANRIRRGGNQILAPEPLLGHSSRSEVGKWWKERNKDANHHLGYMISLFEARLVTASASAVVYSALHHGDEGLKQVATEAGARPDAGNAGRTVEVTEFFRFLAGHGIPEFTSGKKGSLLESTVSAYAAIQGMSSKHHKRINRSICGLMSAHLENFHIPEDNFEVDAGDQNLYIDAVAGTPDNPLNFEFHHLSEGHCRAASMASYIMEKLRNYSIHHNLIPR